ncbi:peptide MFS transporter [Sphingobium abikonense]|uniref:peptide MFS transporter n=1 Tax=Sphingobium abikonense TaxID=86193 RepID=UPI00078784D2|nr:peptide MFS transporter [Sphingobium abikonense]
MAISPADPNRAAQAAEHINDADASWFGHPRQLARLFTTEMWERFGFYGMRALLVLYLTDHFLFSDTSASGTYGAYMSLVYLTPFIGGFIADRYLGSKRSVKFGAIIMAIGYFTLCFGGEAAKPYALVDGQRYEVQVAKQGDARQQYLIDGDARLAIRGHEDGSVDLVNDAGAVERKVEKGGFVAGGERSPFFTMLMLIALSAIVVGNGFFKPNISTIVGELYAVGDRRRDAGFTIFYMGINLGSLFSQILCPWLATSVGWWAGFLLAAIGMLCSWALIQFDGGKLGGYGERPEGANPRKDLLIYALSIAAIPLMWFLFVNVMDAAQAQAGAGIIGYLMALPILGKLLFITFLIAVPAILIWSWRAGSKVEFQMMLAAMVMIVFNVVFWTLFEQAGSSLTLFADRNTDLSVFGLFSLSAGQTQFFNAFFIVTLAPLFSIGWNALGRRGLEPSIPVKFAIALVGVGLGFLVLVWGSAFAGADFKVSIWWLALLYLIHSMAELCISPVGLSMITKLSIVRIVGLMMGVWFMSISVAQYVGGMIAQIASVETVGGQVTNLAVSLQTYVDVFRTIGLASIGLGVLLFILAFPIKRWMHGVQ